VATFKLRMHQNPFGGPELLSGCCPGKGRWVKRKEGEVTEDGRKRVEGGIGKFEGERGGWKGREEKGERNICLVLD